MNHNSINVALIGIGNCSSSLVQGVEGFKHHKKNGIAVAGIANEVFFGYSIEDIYFTTAFDVDSRKVGKDLSEAIYAKPNCTTPFFKVNNLNVPVMKGHLLDGLGEKLKEIIDVDENQVSVDIASVLKETNTKILVNFLPTGSKKATEFYADQAISAGCAFINAIPESIATDESWSNKFKNAGLPLAGDDVKSQIGATILHRALIDLCMKRGVKIEDTYQINFGGNTDFLNLSDSNRSDSKKATKDFSIKSLDPNLNFWFPTPNYVKQLEDHKECLIGIKGELFFGIPFDISLKLRVEDSPNSAGIIIDVIRGIQYCIDNNLSGSIDWLSSYYFKHPSISEADSSAYLKISDKLLNNKVKNDKTL